MDTFEATYKKKLVPILKKHDLEESSERGRSTVKGVFSRLFEVERPSEAAIKERALRNDPAWQKVLQNLGMAFGTTESDGLLRTHFGIYRTPAGPGKTVEAGSGFRQGSWQTFGVRDGLPSPAISHILQDREGYLWFGVGYPPEGFEGGGVSRYDGAQFVTFTTEDGLASNAVVTILEDREGYLWFGTFGGGVSRYDGDQFVTFTTEDGLASNEVRSIVEDRGGNLWFGTGGGVSRYDGKQFVSFTAEDNLANNQVRCILEDRVGHLWFGTGDGVSRYDGEQFVTFATEDGLANNEVRSIVEDREGNLWFGTEDGVSRYDGEQFVTFTTEDGLAYNRVWAISRDRVGELWFGTYGGGVSRYDGEQFVTFTTEDGLMVNRVISILEDREGYLWAGTFGGGVSRYDGERLVTFTTQDGLARNTVRPILEDREGKFWFGTEGGMNRYDGKTFTTLDGLVGCIVWDILEDREGHLWIATLGWGVSWYDGKRVARFTTEDGLAHNKVRAILEDREGVLWFGTWGGVSRYDGRLFETFTTKDGLPHNRIRCMFGDRKRLLWFGTEGGGVSRYDGKEFANFTTEDGLAHNVVECIFEDREGVFWFGTWGRGVSRYDGEQFVTFTAEDGLADNHVYSIFEDREGHLWFGTYGGGVSRYDGLVLQSLSKKDGLTHDSVHEILQDRNGDIWISTEGGVTRYRPHHTPPTIRFTEVIADQRYGSVEEIHLPSSQKFVIFEFQGRSLTTRPDGMAYVVRLEGYDPDWKPNYTGRVEYQDLPLGEYVFQVKAVDRDLNYSESVSVRISVVPDPRLEAFAEALSGMSEEFVGESDALRRVEEQLVKAAPTDMTVLISGETGTGKGLAARILHGLSSRKTGPFIQVSCGAIPGGLVESELFGHERGAFTGAVSRKLGKVELAEGGTLFLDEIGDLAPEAQAKVLQFLEERTFERVGGMETLQVDVRVIAATNRDLKQMVEAGQFRKDLYFRLQEFQVALPPLRERLEDIPQLASYFTARMAAHLSKEVTHLTPEALSALQAYAWPGNVRELEHAVKRAVVVCSGSEIRAEDITPELGKTAEGPPEELVPLEEHERRYIREVLERTEWVMKGPHGAAAVLGLPVSTLRSRMKKLGIQRP